MIEIIDSLSDPIRMLCNKNSNILAGSIVQLKEINGDTVCVLSDGTRPFGISLGKPDDTGLIQVIFNFTILKTKLYDPRAAYDPGDALYSTRAGILTTRKYFSNPAPLGYVVKGPYKNSNYLEINWI